MKSRQPSALNKFAKGTLKVLTSGYFWGIGAFAAIMTSMGVSFSESNEQERLEDEAFRTEVKAQLASEGYKNEASRVLDHPYREDINLPDEFNKVGIFTVSRDGELKDLTVVKGVVSKGGLVKTYVFEEYIVQPGQTREPAVNNDCGCP